MRVIVFVKATDDSEKGVLPTTELLNAMGRYNIRSSTGLSPRPTHPERSNDSHHHRF
jgi:hypothetical protein